MNISDKDSLPPTKLPPTFTFLRNIRPSLKSDCVVILNKVSEHISESHLRQFFEGKFKVPVKKVSIQSDKPTIVFGSELLERGFLKACFKLGLRSRFSRYRKLEEKEYEESK